MLTSCLSFFSKAVTFSCSLWTWGLLTFSCLLLSTASPFFTILTFIFLLSTTLYSVSSSASSFGSSVTICAFNSIFVPTSEFSGTV